jgi:hypothetical protein
VVLLFQACMLCHDKVLLMFQTEAWFCKENDCIRVPFSLYWEESFFSRFEFIYWAQHFIFYWTQKDACQHLQFLCKM